jgi:hypothetical protein
MEAKKMNREMNPTKTRKLPRRFLRSIFDKPQLPTSNPKLQSVESKVGSLEFEL